MKPRPTKPRTVTVADIDPATLALIAHTTAMMAKLATELAARPRAETMTGPQALRWFAATIIETNTGYLNHPHGELH
jgi:hypothetical protein